MKRYLKGGTTASAALSIKQLSSDKEPNGCADSFSLVVMQVLPLSHESYGHMGQPASRFLNEPAILASSTGAVEKRRFVQSSLWELSISLCRGNHRIVAACAASNTRMTGSALIPSLPAPATDAGAMNDM